MDPKLRKGKATKAHPKYPAVVDSERLAFIIAKNKFVDLNKIDLCCGTAFLKALAEVAKKKDEFYLQNIGKTTVVLHIPEHVRWQDNVGHVVERALCGDGDFGKENYRSTFPQATTASIDYKWVLVLSELDASDENGKIIELRSSNSKIGIAFIPPKVALQVLLNGSDYVFDCCLNKDKSHLNQLVWLARDNIYPILRQRWLTWTSGSACCSRGYWLR